MGLSGASLVSSVTGVMGLGVTPRQWESPPQATPPTPAKQLGLGHWGRTQLSPGCPSLPWPGENPATARVHPTGLRNKWETAEGMQKPIPKREDRSDAMPVPAPAKGMINPCQSMCTRGERRGQEAGWQRMSHEHHPALCHPSPQLSRHRAATGALFPWEAPGSRVQPQLLAVPGAPGGAPGGKGHILLGSQARLSQSRSDAPRLPAAVSQWH